MFSKFTLGKKYLQYLNRAENSKGHGVHSPFVYRFIKEILNDQENYGCYAQVEVLRRVLLRDDRVIEVEDFGAGSRVNPTSQRKIADIARSALKSKKFGRLLFRMVQQYQPQTILELGTCFGVTTAYLSNGNKKADVYTMEGAGAIADVARHNFSELSLDHVQLIQGNFDDSLPALIAQLKDAGKTLDFVFIDGNHRMEPTLRYFEQMKSLLHAGSVVIFDDIHWSQGMEDAWQTIQEDPLVTLSLDFFFIGVVFFRAENTAKQHFSIRF